MFRNQYDNDVTVWSPQGRLHQVEYAMEAVKQGAATVGLKCRTHAVLVALKRASSELSAHQKKIMPIDAHVGVSIAGLTADARILSRWMRSECLNSRYAHDRPLPVSRLISELGNKMQVCTQRDGSRPYGVGFLVAGFDESGPHIYQTCPSANYFDCKAMAIGARSQSARTYLEKHLAEFVECSWEQIVTHALLALRDTLPNDMDLTAKNCTVAIVGKDHEFTIFEDDAVTPFLTKLEGIQRRGGHGAAPAAEPAPLRDEPAADEAQPRPDSPQTMEH
ncbi:proteasome subunit alpha type-1-like [Pollicipes pollicipes]|uniref:proteasome subunit alpha type-1-like n=1 Tax=Pollicipes pollicipes TaxID=41117 RepID=UPI0018856682|nr:proteasome subunit alpha type-1-like [Pollicipes pollicipes]